MDKKQRTAWGFKEPEIRHQKTGAIGAVTPQGDTVYGPMAQQFLTPATTPPAQPVVAEESTAKPPVFQAPEQQIDTISLQQQLDKQRKELETRYKVELDRITKQTEEQQKIQQEQVSKQEGVMREADPLTQPFRAGIETSERERLKVEENYFANQSIVNELDRLLTDSIEMTRKLQTQRVPGLAGLQQSSRMTRAAEGIQARIGILEAVMSARNNQIGTALNFIDRTVGQMTNDRNARLDYLNNLFNFYETARSEAGTKIFNLSKEQKDIFNRQTALLEADVERAQANADRIKQMMQENPLMVAQSGISLDDTEEQISKKIAEWQYSEEVRTMKNTAEQNGMRGLTAEEASSHNPEQVFTYIDSKGNEKKFLIPTEWETQMFNNSLYRYDPSTGKTELLLYGGGEEGVTTGEEKVAAQESIKQNKTANNVIETIERMLDNEKGINDATGRLRSLAPDVLLSNEGRAFRQDFETLTGLLTLENMGVMKGVLSDADIKIIKDASRALNPMLGTDEFKRRLMTILQKMQKSVAVNDSLMENFFQESGLVGETPVQSETDVIFEPESSGFTTDVGKAWRNIKSIFGIK